MISAEGSLLLDLMDKAHNARMLVGVAWMAAHEVMDKDQRDALQCVLNIVIGDLDQLRDDMGKLRPALGVVASE